MVSESRFSPKTKSQTSNFNDWEFEQLLKIASTRQARELRRQKLALRKSSLSRRRSQPLRKVFLIDEVCLL